MSNRKIRNSKQKNDKAKKTTVATLETPLGPCRVDLKEAKDALDEVQKWQRMPPTAEEMCHEDYLGGTVSTHRGIWPSRQGSLLLTELEPFVSQEWEVDRLTHFTNRGRRETDPIYREVQIGASKAVEVAMASTRCIQNRESGAKLCLSTWIDCDGDIRLDIRFNRKDENGTQIAWNFLRDFKKHYYAHGPQRGAVFDANLNFIPRHSGADEKLVLPEYTQGQVDLHILCFCDNRAQIEAEGMPTNKGIILSGPPGTGKTLLVKAVVEKTDMTTILVSPEMIRKDTISSVYRMARRYSPSMVILEDVDTSAGIHRKLRDHPVLGEVLQALDGIEDNTGVFTIATTNYLQRIDDALKDRPGRFSRIITVPVPDAETRPILIKRLALEFNVNEADLNLVWLSENTHGYTGDWLRNLFVTARLFAISAGREGISTSDLESAICDIEANRDVAVKPTPEMPPPQCTALSSERSYA